MNLLNQIVNYAPSKLVPGAIGFVAVPIYAKLLGPDELGTFSIIIATLSILSSITISWISGLVIRFHSKFNTKILALSLNRRALYSTILGLIIWMIICVQYSNKTFSLMVSILGIVWLMGNNYIEYSLAWLRAAGSTKSYSRISVVKSIMAFLFSFLLLITLGSSFELLILGQVIVVALISSHLIHNGQKHFQHEITAQTNALSMNINSYIIPTVLLNVLTLLNSIGDRFLIAKLLSFEDLGIYVANYDITEKSVFMVNSIFILISSATAFKIFEQRSAYEMMKYLEKIFDLYVLITLPIVLTFVLYNDEISNFLLGFSYVSGADVIPAIAVSSLFIGFMHRYSVILAAHKKFYHIASASLMALIVNLSLCYFFAEKYGIVGVAVATFFSHLCWLCIVIFYCRNHTVPSFPAKIFLLSLLSYLCICIIVQLLGDHFFNEHANKNIILIFLNFLLYFIVVYFTCLREMLLLRNEYYF